MCACARVMGLNSVVVVVDYLHHYYSVGKKNKRSKREREKVFYDQTSS